MKMRSARTYLANLADAYDEHGKMTSNSMCCGALVFSDKRKMRQAISRAQKDLEDIKLLMQRAKSDALYAFQDLDHLQGGGIAKTHFVEHGGPVLHSYSSGQAKMFRDALENPVQQTVKGEPDQNESRERRGTKGRRSDESAIGAQPRREEASSRGFVPLPESQDILSPFTSNSMADETFSDNDATLFSTTLGRVQEEEVGDLRASRTTDQTGDAGLGMATFGLLRDLWGGSRATKTNSEEKGSKEAYAVDDRAEQFEDDTPDINQLQSELAAMQAQLRARGNS